MNGFNKSRHGSALGLVAVMLCVCLFASDAEAQVFKIATLSPDGSFWMKKMREGAKEIADKTQNRVGFKFYPGGVMGNDKAVLRKIRINELQGGALTGGSLSRFCPDDQALSLPLIYRSQAEIDYVRGFLDPVILKGLEEGGFVCFGLAGGGFAYVMSQSPVASVEDLKKQKVWIPDQDATSAETLETFGITPIPLPLADVRAGLQTGLINTVTVSPVGAVALQWHTQVKYMTTTPVMYIFGTLAISRQAFYRLTPQDQKVVREVMGRVFGEIDRENRKSDQEAFETLKKQGIIQVAPQARMQAEWFSKGPEIARSLVKQGRLTQGMLDALNKHLSDFRSKNAP